MTKFNFDITQQTQTTEFNKVPIFIDRIDDRNGDSVYCVYCKNSHNIYTICGKIRHSGGVMVAEYISKNTGSRIIYKEGFVNSSAMTAYISYCIQMLSTEFKLENYKQSKY